MDTTQIEFEIVSAIMLSDGTQDYIRELTEDDFRDKQHKFFFKQLKKMYLSKKEISFITLRNELIKGNENDAKINYAINDYLARYDGLSSSMMKSNIDKLKEIRTKESFENLLKNALSKLDSEDNIMALKSSLSNDLKKIEANHATKSIKMQEALLKLFDKIEQDRSSKRTMETGFWKLDRYTNGLHESELTCIGARPGTGKTAFALNIATYVAKKYKVYFVSLEMNDIQIMQRIMAAETNINTQKMRNAELDKSEYVKFTDKAGKVSELKLTLDTTSRYIEDVESEISKLKEKDEIDLLIIDYLTLLKSREKYASRELEVADISRRLKLLALDLNIPVIILVQLNRDAENKVPTMANIRESGSIEQNCDNIIFLYDEEKSKEKEITVPRSMISDITVILEKQRQGETGAVKLRFDKPISKFYTPES